MLLWTGMQATAISPETGQTAHPFASTLALNTVLALSSGQPSRLPY